MATEIYGTDGRMMFRSGVDNSGLKKNLKEIETSVDKTTDKVSKMGEKLEGVLDKSLGSAKEKFKKSTAEMADSSDKFAGSAGSAAKSVMGGFSAMNVLLRGLGFVGLISTIIGLLKQLWQENKNFKDSFDALKQNIKATAAALEDGGFVQAKKDMMLLKQEVKLAGDGFLDKNKVVKHYNETLGKSMGQVKSLGQVESKLTEQGPAFIEMTFLKAKAMAAYTEAANLQIQSEKEKFRELSSREKIKSSFTDMDTKDFFTSMFVPSSREDLFKKKEGHYRERMGNRAFNQGTLLKTIGDQAMEAAAKIAAANKNFDLFSGNYEAKSKKSNSFQSENAFAQIIKEISDSGKKFEIQFATNVDSERDKINKFFDDLKFKAEQFNKNPANKIKIAPRYFDEIETNRTNSLTLADYSKETSDLITELSARKKEYEDYEKLKYKIGSEAADKQYKYLIGKHKTYLEALQAEERALYEKGSLNVAENDRYIKIQDLIVKARANQKAAESKWLGEMLTSYATYEQRKAAIINQREDDIKKARESGNLHLIEGITETTERALVELDNATAREKKKLSGFFDEMIFISRDAVKAHIKNLEWIIQNSNLTASQKMEMRKEIANAEKLLNMSSKDIQREQLLAQLEDVNKEIKRTQDGTPKAKEELDKLFKKRGDIVLHLEQLDSFIEKINTLQAVARAAGQLGNVFASMDNPQLAQLGVSLSYVSSAAEEFLSNWQKLKDDLLKDSDKIQMAANFIVSAINSIAQSVQQAKAKEAEALQNIIDYQRGYNLALIEEQKIREQMANSLFYKNNLATIKGSLSAQVKLVNEYNKSMNDLVDGQIKVGTKKVRDWVAVAASTAAGAGTGAVVGASGGILSIPGAIIGEAVGFITGMLKKRQVVDVYDSLLKKYPDLIDAEGKLNDVRTKTLLQSNLLDAKTKDTLQYVSDLTEEYKKAQEEINTVIKDLIGNVGNDVMSELVADFKNGGADAGAAFKKGFAKSLENLYMDAIYASIFGPGLDAMQKRIEEGFKSGDMEVMEKAMFEFLDTYRQKAQAAQGMMKQAQDYAKMKGIDIFTPNEGADAKKNKNSLSGAYAQASQESINLLAGQTQSYNLTLISLKDISFAHFKVIETAAFKNLEYAQQTAYNTGATVDRLDSAVSELKSIKNKMDNNANNALAAGI